MKYLAVNLLGLCVLFSLMLHSFIGLGLYFVPSSPKQPHLHPQRHPPIIMTVTQPTLAEETPKRMVKQNTDLSHRSPKAPKNAQFLSQFHQKVEKETVAHKINLISKQKKRSIASTKKEPNVLPQLSDLTPQLDWDKYIMAMRSKKASKKKTAVNPQHLGEQLTSSDPINDYIDDLMKADQTLLNTKAFQFYTYYDRIRTQVQASWEPLLIEEVRGRFLIGNPIVPFRQRTRLLVILNQSGSLIDIKVLEKSHYEILDRIAIKGFLSSAPFPNPPKQLIRKDGTLWMRWDFILDDI